MSDTFDYSNIIRKQYAAQANSSIAATDGVSPEQAGTAIQHEAGSGIPAAAGMYQPEQSRELAQASQQQAVLGQNPKVAAWIAAANPAHVAAAKDDLLGLAKIGAYVQQAATEDFQGVLAGWAKQNQQQTDELKNYTPAGGVKNFLSDPLGLKQAWQTAQNLWNTAGLAAIPMDVGLVRPAAHLLSYLPEQDIHGNTIPYEERVARWQNQLGLDLFALEHGPGRGANSAVDVARAAVATADVEHATGLQATIAASPIHARSPSTIEDFIHSQVPDQTVRLEPEALIQLAMEGHDLSPLGVEESLPRALATGDQVEIPYSRYQVAVAGQPYAEALNSQAVFREGGVSVEDAKAASKAEPEEESQSTTSSAQAPADFTPEEADRYKTLAAQAESAVDQVVREQYLTPMPIEHSTALGMTEGEMEKYGEEMRAASEEARARAVAKVEAQIRRERKPDWQEAVARHTEAERARLEDLPAVKAWREMAEKGMKLDRDLVQDAYPEPSTRLPDGILRAKGNHPDAAADYLGYESAGQMVSDVADLNEAVKASGARGLSDYINKQAKAGGMAQAEKELGEGFFDRDSMHRLAMESIPEDKATGVLETELRQLAEANGGSFNRMQLNARAKQTFQSRRVGDILNPQRLNERIRRLGEKAERALLKGQFGAAFGYKQVQFMHRLQLREALAFQRDFRRTTDAWGKLASSRTLKGMDQTALNYIHAIQTHMGYAVSSHAADLPPISTLNDYVDMRNRSGAEVIQSGIPPASDKLAKYLKGLSVDQFQGLRDMIKSIATDGRNQQTVVRGGIARSADDIRTQMVSSLNRYTREITREEQESPTMLQKVDAARRGLDAWLVRLEQLMLDFGGRNPDSPYFEHIIRPLEDAKGWKDDMLIQLAKHFQEVSKTVGKNFDDWLSARVENAHAGTGYNPVFTETGDDLFITNKDIVVAAAHMGDESALRKFADGYGATPAQIEAIVHKHMTNEGWNMVEGLWQAFDMFSKDVQEAYMRRNGVHLTMVEPRPFEAPAGSPAAGRKLAGGYYPVMYDFDNLSDQVKAVLKSKDDVLGASEYRTFLPASNYMKTRTGFTAPIDMSLDLTHVRLRQMVHDLAYRDVLMDMQKLLLHKDTTDAISYKYGPEYVEKIRQDVRAIAGAESGGGTGFRIVSKVVNYLTTAQQVSLIGFNPGTAIKHGLTAGFHSMQTVGVGPFLRASMDLYRGGGDLRKALDAESNELRNRSLNASEQARMHFENLQGKDDWRHKVVVASHWLITELDKESARQVYMAAKQKELDRQQALGLPADPDKAIALGNQAVRQAHGSTGVTDAAAALRADNTAGGAFYRGLTRFLNFFNHNYNRMREIPQAMGYAGETPDPMRAMGLIATYALITGAIGSITAGEWKGAKGGINWLGGIASSLMHVAPTSTLPGFEDVSSGAQWVAGGEKGRPRAGMLMQTGYMYGSVMADIAKAVGDRSHGPQHRHHVEQLIQDASNAALTSFQLPGGALAKLERWGFQSADPVANPKRTR